MAKPAPLQRKTMTLEELRHETLKVLKQVRKQFNRQHYQEGMTDTEFVDKVVGSFEHDIKADIAVLKKRGYRHPCSLCRGTGY